MELDKAVKQFNKLSPDHKELVKSLGHVLSGEYQSEYESTFEFVRRTFNLGNHYNDFRKTYCYENPQVVWSMAYYIGTIIDNAVETSWDFGYADINAGVANYRIPKGNIHFKSTEFCDDECVISIGLAPNNAYVEIYVRRDSLVNLNTANHKLREYANKVSYYRGWPLLCEVDDREGFLIRQINTDPISRDKLFYRDAVWNAIDKNMEILYSKNQLMRDLSLDTRRGLLLYGPPGTGKSALTTTIINERQDAVTALIVTPKVAIAYLRDVYEFAAKMGKCIIVLEDIDMYLGDRAGNNSMALPEFLNILDGVSKYNDIVTIGTTNEKDVLDEAAMRSARFDVLIQVDYPNKEAQTSILTKYLGPHAGEVNIKGLVSLIPDKVSGADIREMIRFTVLNHDELNTENLIDTIKNGRWKSEAPAGFFL